MAEAPERVLVEWTSKGNAKVMTPASAGRVTGCKATYVLEGHLAAMKRDRDQGAVDYTKLMERYDALLVDIAATEKQLVDVLVLVKQMIDEALPKFNWGASALDANAIRLLNEVPIAVNAALKAATNKHQESGE